MTEGFEHTRPAAEVEDERTPALSEPTKTPIIRTLEATKGGILQTITGDKTISLGYDSPRRGLHFLKNKHDDRLSVPVMVEGVQENVNFRDITEEQARAAGFSSKERMGLRLLASAAGSTGQEGSNTNLQHDLEWLNHHSKFSLTTIRLATPDEIALYNHSPAEVRKTVEQTVSNIFANPDLTVDRALTKLGKGENTLKIELERAIDKQFASADRSVA